MLIDFLPNNISYKEILGAFYPQRTFDKQRAFARLGLSAIGASRNLEGAVFVHDNSPIYSWTNYSSVFVLFNLNEKLVGLEGTKTIEPSSFGGNEYCDACSTQQDTSRIRLIAFKHGILTIGHRLCENMECVDYINGTKQPYIVTGYKISVKPKDDLLLSTLEFWNNFLLRLNFTN